METATGMTKVLRVIEIITLIKTNGAMVKIEKMHRDVLMDKL